MRVSVKAIVNVSWLRIRKNLPSNIYFKKYVEKLAEDDNAFIKSIFIKVLPVIVM